MLQTERKIGRLAPIIFVLLILSAPARAEQGNTAYDIINKPVDRQYAWNILKPLADNDDPEAQIALGILYARRYAGVSDTEEADKWFQKALAIVQPRAVKGDPQAQMLLGKMCENGYGTVRDKAEAGRWYQESFQTFMAHAERGDAKAQVQVGLLYQQGEGVAADGDQAKNWYLKAAKKGDADAQLKLGKLYMARLQNAEPPSAHPAQDAQEAVNWFLKAARQGNTEAQVALGDAYSGRLPGMYPYPDKAEEWYLKAAEGHGEQVTYGGKLPQTQGRGLKWYHTSKDYGAADVQFKLGNFYMLGRVKTDYAEAEKWYRKAAEQGDVRAEFVIANLHETEAIASYVAAAQQGDVMAERRLAEMYQAAGDEGAHTESQERLDLAGETASNILNSMAGMHADAPNETKARVDYEEAFFWYSLKEELIQGRIDWDYFPDVVKHLAPSEKDAGLRRVAQWLTDHHAEAAAKKIPQGIAEVPMDKPCMDTPALLAWAASAAPGLMTFNYTDYERRLPNSGRYFTKEGRKKFAEEFNHSKLLNVVTGHSLLVSAVLKTGPAIEKEGAVDGKYQWVVSAPLLVTYENVGKTYKHNRTLPIRLVIERDDNPYGIAIAKWEPEAEFMGKEDIAALPPAPPPPKVTKPRVDDERLLPSVIPSVPVPRAPDNPALPPAQN